VTSGSAARGAGAPPGDGARTWRFALAACAVVAAIQAATSPLADPDLPGHLAVGEWIATHRAVPFAEPFAWTRAGEPYFAYSWLLQLIFYRLLDSTGPAGLHLLAGGIGAGIVLASACAARAQGATPAATAGFAALSAAVAFESTPFLRPQLLMHLLVPLGWLCCSRLASADRPARTWLAAFAAIVALAAATHITFPLLLAPLTIVAVRAERWRRVAGWGLAAFVAGALASPYALRWVDVFQLNLASNVLTVAPTASGELRPGFTIAPVAGSAIALLSLAGFGAAQGGRARLVHGLLSLAGLLLFVRLFKGLGPWWWCSTPLVIAALRRLPTASTARVRAAFATSLAAALATGSLLNLRMRPLMRPYESGTLHGSLPSIKGYASEPAASWLLRHLRPDASGRLLTTFNYGGYLGWRLPRLSPSIDGRTIFPDSAAMPDAAGHRLARADGPWRSADVAIIPADHPAVQALGRTTGWLKVGTAAPAPWAPVAPRATLWVKRDWLSRVALDSTTLPSDGLLR
jgi:hypothetical protein